MELVELECRLYIVRNTAEAKMAAKEEGVCVKEQLSQETEMRPHPPCSPLSWQVN